MVGDSLIFLRGTVDGDIESIYKNIHAQYIKKYYPGKEKEQWENHKRWYKFLIKSPSYALYTVTNKDEEFLGYVKFEIDEEFAIINIFLIEEMRGKNISSDIIRLSMEEFTFRNSKISVIFAYILEENTASIKAFRKVGFVFDSLEEYKGLEHMLFIKTLD